MKLKKDITSDRLLIKTLTKEYVTQEYVSWLNSSSVNQFLESRFVEHTLESTEAFVDSCYHSSDSLLIGVFDLEFGDHIGNLKIGPINPYHKNASIGIMLGNQNYWGKGIATESIKLVTDYAFAEMNIEKLFAGCYETNIGSKKAFEKVGYLVEGFQKDIVENIHGFREGSWTLGVSRRDVIE